MNILTVALGQPYIESAQQLKLFIPNLQIVSVPLPEDQMDTEILTAKKIKTSFFKYITSPVEGPVILMDADFVTKKQNPFINFPVVNQVAGVQWLKGLIYRPAPFNTLPPDAIQINSGFVAFANLNIASAVSTKWSYLFESNYATHGYPLDETNLAAALHELDIIPELLDIKWNASEETADTVFIHSHYSRSLSLQCA